MRAKEDLLGLAQQYHHDLPARIRCHLNQRGIPDVLIDLHLLGWNGQRITIPIFHRDGELAFFKLARNPDDGSESPKMLSTLGANAELYGWEQVLARPKHIIICERELDRLVLGANGFPAVTSTGGAATFRSEWAEEIALILFL